MRVLVIGIDGVIGGSLARSLLAHGHKVTGTTRRKAHIDLPDTIYFDLADGNAETLPEAEATVICAAMARFRDCRSQPPLARRVNVDRPIEIAERQLSRGARVLLLSTSAVFDCLKPNRKADDTRAPRSDYGQLKAEAETRLLELGKGTGVLRLTKIVQSTTGILQTWIDDLASGQTVTAFGDHRFSPLPLLPVVDTIGAILESEEGGLFQISGADDISYADAANMFAKFLGLPAGRVSVVSATKCGIVEGATTPYTSLDTSRLTAMTGFVPPRALEVLTSVYGPALERARTAAAANS